jgi:hypothetical protein
MTEFRAVDNDQNIRLRDDASAAPVCAAGFFESIAGIRKSDNRKDPQGNRLGTFGGHVRAADTREACLPCVRSRSPKSAPCPPVAGFLAGDQKHMGVHVFDRTARL